MPVERELMSVFDKMGTVEFAQGRAFVSNCHGQPRMGQRRTVPALVARERSG